MLMPTIFRNDAFEDLFKFPTWNDVRKMEIGPFGGGLRGVMKADVTEKDDAYEIAMDLPGYKKDDVSISLDDGIMTVKAERKSENEKKDENGKVVYKERFEGSASRSFFVGKTVTEEDVKAKYEDGVLKIDVPKKEPKEQERKLISIE